jgi:hypothetical protein
MSWDDSDDVGPERCSCGKVAEPGRERCHACEHGMLRPKPSPYLRCPGCGRVNLGAGWASVPRARYVDRAVFGLAERIDRGVLRSQVCPECVARPPKPKPEPRELPADPFSGFREG